MPLKPKVVGDLVARRRGWTSYSSLPSRINLSQENIVRVPLTPGLRWLAIGIAAVVLIFGSASAPTLGGLTRAASASADATSTLGIAASSTDVGAEQAALQAQLADLEGQINQYQGQIASYQTQGKTLSSQINQLNAKIASLNLQIKAINLTLSQLDEQIAQTQSQIQVTQGDITQKKVAIAGLMNSLYQNDQQNLMEIFLKNPTLADFWKDSQDITLLQDNLRVAVQQITDLQSQLQGQEQEFAASRDAASMAKAYQAAQAALVASTKDQKTELLAETKGQETKYQQLLAVTQASAAQIRSRIFQLLGGGQLSFGDAYQYAKLAGNATGIDPAFVLAILDHESALGQNVGKCSYKTAMSPANIPVFLDIVNQLHLDPNTMLVSCPNADGAYGGAMGPAQFVPSTWELYAPGISAVTGNNPPSPWNNSDAFAATALFLKDAMTGCKAAYSAVLSQERCTAAKYYAGSHWKSYLWTYGEAVVERAQGFASDIQTLNQAGTS
ncbi:MAG TPA: lytic murein transglycosylase [Candidatus Paceibacterota bacterium]|nr:lytic murein transglycosylase [Candidatus Paceibacterota bacterium]